MSTKQDKKSLQQYLGEKGYASPISDYMLDKMVHPHGLTRRQRMKLEKDCQKHARQYQEERSKYIQEYKNLVDIGEIKPLNNYEELLLRCAGHEDREDTKASRRLLKKKYGIEYKKM